ncbi:MATE family efflux transporter [Micrococcus luteus]|uniref:hypothetical protein n=1 Tax=Micrococcus luteus TaxID=1270 RepID=UPI0011A062E2|nr:hypothetical protein [Micrococcus luteus]
MKKTLLLGTFLNAASTLAPQFMGMLVLASAEFGAFSAVYLAYALAIAVTMSVLADAWVIGSEEVRRGGWAVYSSVLVSVSVLFSFVGAGIAWLAWGQASVIFLSLFAVALANYRSGVRYVLVHEKRWNRTFVLDGIALLGTVAGFPLFISLGMTGLEALTAAWAAGSLLGALAWRLPHVSVPDAALWVKGNRRLIRPLLIDTVAMEATAIGTPFLLLPVLGLSGFGIYRSVANLSAPLRKLIAPVRPLLIAAPRRAMSARFTAMILGCSGAVGIAAFAVLEVVAVQDWRLGVLGELTEFTLPVTIYLFSALIVVYYSLMCRSLNRPKLLLSGRFFYTAVGVVGPLTGFIVGGISGAIWGFAIASLVSGIVWYLLACAALRGAHSTERSPGRTSQD